jgi:glycerophosphoryl diester phosphodiesterase
LKARGQQRIAEAIRKSFDRHRRGWRKWRPAPHESDHMNLPFLWAHRGASCSAPENTLAAFNAAVECGADGIELDIHLSRDGIPVVIHDETLDRTTDGYGPVAMRDLSQIRQLDAGSWFAREYLGEQIPTLESVLNVFGGHLRLNLEVKDAEAGKALLELLGRYPSADVVVSSFNYESLRALRDEDSTLALAVLFDSGNWRRALRLAGNISACAFHPRADKVNRPMIAACQRASLPVFVWTVDNPHDAMNLVRSGVSGFFTNDPARLRAIFPRAGQQ